MLTLRDLRYAMRALGQAPARTLVLVLTLAVGIGANSAMFSFVSAVLLRPLPIPDLDRMVSVWKTKPFSDSLLSEPSYPVFEAWQNSARSFDGMAAMSSVNLTFTWQTHDQPQTLAGRVVSQNFFDVLRVSASPGAHVHVGGGASGYSKPRRGHQPRPVAARVRREPRSCRYIDSLGRREFRGDWRDASRLPLSRAVRPLDPPRPGLSGIGRRPGRRMAAGGWTCQIRRRHDDGACRDRAVRADRAIRVGPQRRARAADVRNLRPHSSGGGGAFRRHAARPRVGLRQCQQHPAGSSRRTTTRSRDSARSGCHADQTRGRGDGRRAHPGRVGFWYSDCWLPGRD